MIPIVFGSGFKEREREASVIEKLKDSVHARAEF